MTLICLCIPTLTLQGRTRTTSFKSISILLFVCETPWNRWNVETFPPPGEIRLRRERLGAAMQEHNTAVALAKPPSQSQGASPVASIAGDDMRDAWSCPLPNEIFEVGSQGQDEDIAGLGVAIALGKLLSAGCTPVRQVSHTADPLPLCLSPH